MDRHRHMPITTRPVPGVRSVPGILTDPGVPTDSGTRSVLRGQQAALGSILRCALMVLFALLIGSDALAQRTLSRSADVLAAGLREAILARDGIGMMQSGADVIEIEVLGERRYYSRGQASMLLEKRLRARIPTSAQIIRNHRTSSAAFVQIRVRAVNDGAADWSVRYAFQRGAWRIREITIEKADE